MAKRRRKREGDERGDGSGDDQRPTIPDDQIRAAYPELTRCDHCGVLDPHTEHVARVGMWYWLHTTCADAFKPVISEPVARSFGPRHGGAWQFKRWPKSKSAVRWCGGARWCECGDHKFRFEFSLDLETGEVGPIIATAPEPKPKPGQLCAYCDRPAFAGSPLQYIAIGQPGHSVEIAWLHGMCERGFLRLIEPSKKL